MEELALQMGLAKFNVGGAHKEEEVKMVNGAEGREGNPLIDAMKPVDVEGFAKEQEEARRKPLPNARWKFQIGDYEVLESGPNSKVPKTPMVKFICNVMDPDPEWNGRTVRTGPLMLAGPGFVFFMGDGKNLKGFVEIVTPSREWDAKKKTRLVGEDRRSEYLDSFVGCEFAATTKIDHDTETGEETGWNSMGQDYQEV